VNALVVRLRNLKLLIIELSSQNQKVFSARLYSVLRKTGNVLAESINV
jgi:hypothetical protein